MSSNHTFFILLALIFIIIYDNILATRKYIFKSIRKKKFD